MPDLTLDEWVDDQDEYDPLSIAPRPNRCTVGRPIWKGGRQVRWEECGGRVASDGRCKKCWVSYGK